MDFLVTKRIIICFTIPESKGTWTTLKENNVKTLIVFSEGHLRIDIATAAQYNIVLKRNYVIVDKLTFAQLKIVLDYIQELLKNDNSIAITGIPEKHIATIAACYLLDSNYYNSAEKAINHVVLAFPLFVNNLDEKLVHEFFILKK